MTLEPEAPARRVAERPLFLALALLLALALTGCGARAPRASSLPSPMPTATPPYRAMVSIARAWGSAAATATFSTQLDATHYMPSFHLAPDGHSLDGYTIQQTPPDRIASTPAEAGVLDIASGQFTPIGVASLPKCIGSSCQDTGNASYYLNCCQTDGRFLIAQSTGYPGPDCGGCLYAYDQQTRARYEALPAAQYQGVSTYLLDHATLVASTGVGIVVADLARQTRVQLPGTTGGTQLDGFAWPYAVFGAPRGGQGTSTDIPTPLAAYNVASGATTDLEQVTGTVLALSGGVLYYAATPAGGSTGALMALDLTQPNAQPRMLAPLDSGPTIRGPQSLAVTDGALFYTVTRGLPQGNGCFPGAGVVCPTTAPAPPPVTTLYEVATPPSGAPSSRAIGAYAADLGDVAMADARVVVLAGAVWDRAEDRFVDLGTRAGASGANPPAFQQAAGGFLLVAHALGSGWQSPYQVSIYDTSRLPTLTA